MKGIILSVVGFLLQNLSVSAQTTDRGLDSVVNKTQVSTIMISGTKKLFFLGAGAGFGRERCFPAIYFSLDEQFGPSDIGVKGSFLSFSIPQKWQKKFELALFPFIGIRVPISDNAMFVPAFGAGPEYLIEQGRASPNVSGISFVSYAQSDHYSFGVAMELALPLEFNLGHSAIAGISAFGDLGTLGNVYGISFQLGFSNF